jgi:hypothetical protein
MPDDLSDIFRAIRPLYAEHENRAVVLDDSPDSYILGTHEVRENDGYRTWFGGVQIKKRYVSAHLMPVYSDPTLLDPVSDDLRRRMQGKSCFNFTRLDEGLIEEFADLVGRSAAACVADGRLIS